MTSRFNVEQIIKTFGNAKYPRTRRKFCKDTCGLIGDDPHQLKEDVKDIPIILISEILGNHEKNF